MNTTVASVTSVDLYNSSINFLNYEYNIYNQTSGTFTISCDNFLPEKSVLSSKWFQITTYFLYMIVFFAALVGNGLVCYVVLSMPRMSLTNYYILNLAVADLLMDLFCVPTTFISTLILQYWPFNEQLCPSVNYSQAVSVLVSAYTLVAISVDRYIAIIWPLRPRISKTHAKFSIIGVWLLALTASLPIAVVSKLYQPDEEYVICEQYVCGEVWPSIEYRYYYSVALLVFQYVIPIAVLVFTYLSIGFVVWGKRPPGEAENSRDRRMARSKRKMIKMMMIVVIAFTICWLPFNILILMLDHTEKLKSWRGLPYLWMCFHWLAMSHTCYNPVIYCWMNARFRSGFLVALSRIPGCRCINRDQLQGTYNLSSAGFVLQGYDGRSSFLRTNTCTTWVSHQSMRQNNSNHHSIPLKSLSLRCRDSGTRINYVPTQHRNQKIAQTTAENIV